MNEVLKIKKPLVINLFGGPGAGKSTAAAYLFAELKMRGIKVELVTEYAKDLAWENNQVALSCQAHIFGEQWRRMQRCEDKVDVIVVDSPLFLSIVYNEDKRLSENFYKTVCEVFKSYDNYNFFIKRQQNFEQEGRVHNEEQSLNLDNKIRELLERWRVPFIQISGTREGYFRILDCVLTQLGEDI